MKRTRGGTRQRVRSELRRSAPPALVLLPVPRSFSSVLGLGFYNTFSFSRPRAPARLLICTEPRDDFQAVLGVCLRGAGNTRRGCVVVPAAVALAAHHRGTRHFCGRTNHLRAYRCLRGRQFLWVGQG